MSDANILIVQRDPNMVKQTVRDYLQLTHQPVQELIALMIPTIETQ
jgi:hypothetical protein